MFVFVIPFQFDVTKKFALPINGNLVVKSFECIEEVRDMFFANILTPKLSTTSTKTIDREVRFVCDKKKLYLFLGL